MQKARHRAVGSCLFILVAASGVSGAPPQVNEVQKGRIEFTEVTFDFGYMSQQAVFSHRFDVRNAGREMLNIVKVEPTCGCTSVPLDKAFLKPGEKTGIRVNFDSQKFQGNINKRIKVLSTDPDNGLIELFITGVVGKHPETVELVGSALSFNEIGVLSREIRVKNISAHDLALSVLPPVDTFLIAAVSQSRITPQAEAVLSVKLRSSPPLGEFKSSITLEAGGERKERVSVPVTGIGYAR